MVDQWKWEYVPQLNNCSIGIIQWLSPSLGLKIRAKSKLDLSFLERGRERKWRTLEELALASTFLACVASYPIKHMLFVFSHPRSPIKEQEQGLLGTHEAQSMHSLSLFTPEKEPP